MEKAQILVVEDEGIVAEGLKTSLERLNYVVPGIASSGEEAIEKAEKTHPDLVLMDIRLKGDMDGVEAGEQIRDRFNIPVVYLTAHTDEDTLQRAKRTEPFGYILKPFEIRELHTTVEIALHKHKTERELKQRVATILRGIADAVIATNKKGQVTFMNPLGESLTGWKQEDALGKDLREVLSIIDEEKGNFAQSPVMKAIGEGVIINLTNRWLISREGRKTPIDVSAAPVRDDTGKITGEVLVFRDISERVQAEKALRESEERFDLAVGATKDGIWDWNIITNEEYFSPRWCDSTLDKK